MLDFIALLFSVEPIHAFGENELRVFNAGDADDFMRAFNVYCKSEGHSLSMYKLDADTYITIDSCRADPDDVAAVITQCQ